MTKEGDKIRVILTPRTLNGALAMLREDDNGASRARLASEEWVRTGEREESVSALFHYQFKKDNEGTAPAIVHSALLFTFPSVQGMTLADLVLYTITLFFQLQNWTWEGESLT